jgi:ornithine cyclodeaminase
MHQNPKNVMEGLFLGDQEVQSLLTIQDCIELVTQAHQRLANGEAIQPLRAVIKPPRGILATMPAYLGGDEPVLGIKAVTVYHENVQKGIESHQATILLLNPETGRLMAMIDGARITAMRTAAASGVATKMLAKRDASKLALIGAGVQAHSHLLAIAAVRKLERVFVWNRTNQKAKSFVEKYTDDFAIESCETVEDAVQYADIICTLTASSTPILEHTWVQPGAHINAVGSSTPNAREVSSELMANASLFTDVVESALNEAGDVVIPLHEGILSGNPFQADLGQLVTKKHHGRATDDEITIYKSLGVGIQDIITANYVFKQAQQRNMGFIIKQNY